jgi:hypothetical protein
MIRKIKTRIKGLISGVVDEAIREHEARTDLARKIDPATKVAQRHLFNSYQEAVARGARWNLRDVGFRIFSQFEEDGLLLYLFAAIGTSNKSFVDVGSADGINSNCANLAINFGWDGLFIDGSHANIERGREFYKKHPDTWAYPPQFVQAIVQRENINELIESAGFRGAIDLLSIDIDGNDYWIWDALNVIEPRVVIIETHIEFGMRSIVVPYDKDYSYPGKHPDYHGASPVAMAKLAGKKGYRLVGANNYGFNTIYIKKGIGEDILPEVSVESILSHPRNKEREQLFEPIKNWEYLTV